MADSIEAEGGQGIRWRDWGAQALEEAAETDRPVLLTVTARWCADCTMLDRTTFSDAAIVALTCDRVLPIRADADRQPHVRDRYNAAGWPIVALLTPGGDLLWSGRGPSADQLRKVASSVLQAWHERREEIERDIDRRVTALRSARQRGTGAGLVRREAADDVLTSTQNIFDVRNGGFGDVPKYLPPDAIDMLFIEAERHANPDWAGMAERTLDGALAGTIFDREDGGFFRLAHAADWTNPATEKLLETNAWALRAFALGAVLKGRDDWAHAAETTIDWAERRLRREDGLWGASLAADTEYYSTTPRTGAPPVADRTVLTDANAQWCAALAEAGARFGRPEWVERAATALDTLLNRMDAGDGLLYHYLGGGGGGQPQLAGLLSDVVEAARACITLAQVSGERAWVERTSALALAMEQRFWADDGGFEDVGEPVERVGALRHRERTFEQNAVAAGVLVDLCVATDSRDWRALAERSLALLAPRAGRYGVGAAAFALAAERFFEPPTRLVVVGNGPAAYDLRMRALSLPRADRQVWSLPEGGSIGGRRLRAVEPPAIYVCDAHRVSPPIHDLQQLHEAVPALR